MIKRKRGDKLILQEKEMGEENIKNEWVTKDISGFNFNAPGIVKSILTRLF